MQRATPLIPGRESEATNVKERPLVYAEDFQHGPGGWLGWVSNSAGASRLRIDDGAAVSEGPWWIDYNHAPPGGGYLHLLFALHTYHWEGFPEQYLELGGVNRFIEGGYPRDFTNARIHARLRGEVEMRGARCALLVQSKVSGKYVNCVFIGETFEVRPEWSWQSIALAPDPAQWVALGARHDRTGTYGDAGIAEVLRDVNGDIILVLFPLNVKPAEAIPGDMHRLRAGEDYAVDRSLLPGGYVMMDEIRIEWDKEHQDGDRG